ncbi:MAG: hypothetical protein M1830_006270 [Pleopsidium flavum]|nr:MAG: hypothetical protein M1830_006270 [Pleopsidium flavum]
MSNSTSNPSLLDPSSAMENSRKTKQRAEAVKIAKQQETAVHEKLKRSGQEIPKYEFLELIGKGAYGRVFKSRNTETSKIVALKVVDVDSTDYKANAREKDENIKDFIHEIKVLKQLKESNAKNVNIIYDAFSIHSQLWIVSEYCPGGSVHTLMRATGDKLVEKYIIPIARELAEALKAVHEAGIIHRDVKAANVLISEDGRLQLCDFGIAGVLQTKADKRNTIIGTPYWMPPEMHKQAPPEGVNYGTEIDVWAYGCTLYEVATGLPPNVGIQPGRQLGAKLRKEPRLEGGDYSEGLRDLVAFVLEGRPHDRPSMEAVLKQPYLLNSPKKYPTNSLTELIKTYYRWEQGGGQRQSLFLAGGAAGAEFPETLGNTDSWNFSTTANFEQQFTPSTYNNNNHETTLAPASIFDSDFTSHTVQDNFEYLSASTYDPFSTPQKKISTSTSMSDSKPADTMSPDEKADVEERVKRGEKAMQGLFDENKAPYEYVVKDDFVEAKAKQPILNRSFSDLPLRNETDRSSARFTQIDMGEFDPTLYETTPNIDLGNVPTIKASRRNRLTKDYEEEDEHEGMPYGGLTESARDIKDWKFPTFTDDQATSDNENDRGATQDWQLPHSFEATANENTDRRATKDWKFPTSFELENDDKANRRATQDWKFPSMLPEPADAVDPLCRPTLKQTATAPVRDLSTMITKLNLEKETIIDDTSPFTAMAPTGELTTAAKIDHDKANDDDVPRPSTANSAASDADYDPFKFDLTVDKKKDDAVINKYLDGKGITDPMARVAHRRELRKAKAHALKSLNTTVAEAGHDKFAASHALTVPNFIKTQSIWDKYDPDKNPAPEDRPGAYPFGLPARVDDEDHPLNRGLKSLDGGAAGRGGGESSRGGGRGGRGAPAAARVGGVRRGGGGRGRGRGRGGRGRGGPRRVLAFPEPIPPSAEAMMEGAAPAVVEGELRRLVTDWMTGLGVLRQALAGEGEVVVDDEEEGEGEGDGEGDVEDEDEG